MNILVAEDEKDVRSLLSLSLGQSGFAVWEAANGLEAFELFKKQPIDLCLLDVMMPGLDGFNLLRKIREQSTVPVIMLTARGEEMDKLLGLGIGADDYIVKPFSVGELLARVNALLRRSHDYRTDNSSAQIKCGSLILDKSSCCVTKDGRVVELNAKEYKLLLYLMEHKKQVFTKKQLYCAVWDEDVYYDDNTIMVHISHIRSKIEDDAKNPTYIKTVRGLGYRFDDSGSML